MVNPLYSPVMKMDADLLVDIAMTISELRDSGRIKTLTNTALSNGVPALEIVERGLRRGLDSVGKRYEAGEYFLSELLFASLLMNEAIEILEPRLKLESVEKKGTIVIGTVRGDLHDIGKNVFKMLAQASGFDVHDLGVDVEPESFAKKLSETGAGILALSALLSTSRWEMKVVIDRLVGAGLRRGVKVILGGNAVTKDFAREVGADDAALNAVEGVEICKRWAMER